MVENKTTLQVNKYADRFLMAEVKNFEGAAHKAYADMARRTLRIKENSSLLIAFTSFQLLTYPPERLQFQRISIQLVLHIYVGFINIFDSGFFCHAYNKIFLCYAHSQAKNYTAWDPFHHHRRLHNAASYHSPFFIVFMALFFD